MEATSHHADAHALKDAFNSDADIRLLTVLAVGFVEQNLPVLCAPHLGIQNEEKIASLFKANFRSLISRIDLALAVGAIDNFVAIALKKMGEIRNKFAHHPSITSLDHPDVADKFDALEKHLLSELDVADRSATPREVRFRWVIMTIVGQLFELLEDAWGGTLEMTFEPRKP